MSGQDRRGEENTRQDTIRQDRIGQVMMGQERLGQVSHHHKNKKTTSKQLGFDLIVISVKHQQFIEFSLALINSRKRLEFRE